MYKCNGAVLRMPTRPNGFSMAASSRLGAATLVAVAAVGILLVWRRRRSLKREAKSTTSCGSGPACELRAACGTPSNEEEHRWAHNGSLPPPQTSHTEIPSSSSSAAAPTSAASTAAAAAAPRPNERSSKPIQRPSKEPPPPSGPPPLGSIIQLQKETGRSRKDCKAALVTTHHDYDAARWALLPSPPGTTTVQTESSEEALGRPSSEPIDGVFDPAPRFAGGRPGWLYKRGPLGVGYYRDGPLSVAMPQQE